MTKTLEKGALGQHGESEVRVGWMLERGIGRRDVREYSLSIYSHPNSKSGSLRGL